jgi:isoquinoline 1-oxidoreductase beta subunit
MKSNRRTFLKLCSMAGGGVLLNIAVPFTVNTAERTLSFQANVYLRFKRDGTVVYRDTKPEMGQATSTGLAMVICDELGADWATFTVERPPLTDSMEFDHSLDASAGSNGMLSAYLPLRQAAANVREMFVRCACDIWGSEISDCKVENSQVIHKKNGRALKLSDLFSAVTHKQIPTNAPLKDEADFTLIGKSTSILENRDIVTGKQQFSIDISLEGMVHASIERCPTTDGTLKSFEDKQCLATKGVMRTIVMPFLPFTAPQGSEWQEKYRGSKSGVAVIASSTWEANNGRRSLQVVWSESKYKDFDSQRIKEKMLDLPEDKIRDVASYGRVNKMLSQATNEKKFYSQYYNPYQENAQMEPLNAVADYDGKILTIWAGSQSPTQAIGYVAEVTGVPINNIVFHSMRSGGGFGRRYFYDFIAEAGYLAVKLQQPVKVTWTREDCIRHGRYHLARHDAHTLLLDDDNNPIAWDVLTYSGSNYGYLGRNIMLDYYAGSTQHRSYRHAEGSDLVLFPGSWRSVGAHPEGLARECFIDEVAVKLRRDPLELRQQWLSNKALPFIEKRFDDAAFKRRLATQIGLLSIVKKASETEDWQKSLSPSQGKGVSLSYFYGTFVCQMAYVSYKDDTIKIDKIVCLFDCGQVVNPQTVKAQIEGSIIWSLSALLNPAIDVKNGMVVQSNFDDYKVIRMDAIPEIEIHLLKSNRLPNRVGEAAVPDTGPAVLNAIFNVTGQRIKELPIPDRILSHKV